MKGGFFDVGAVKKIDVNEKVLLMDSGMKIVMDLIIGIEIL